ncbi:MAG: hypothetical protein QGF90_05640, partial [Gammaproteobacteria bacterium]|nr:hypothetical protein [Gammaproteobacteria bacterium]
PGKDYSMPSARITRLRGHTSARALELDLFTVASEETLAMELVNHIAATEPTLLEQAEQFL